MLLWLGPFRHSRKPQQPILVLGMIFVFSISTFCSNKVKKTKTKTTKLPVTGTLMMNKYFAQDVCQCRSPPTGVVVMSARTWKAENPNLLKLHQRLLPKTAPDNNDWESQVFTFHSVKRDFSFASKVTSLMCLIPIFGAHTYTRAQN